MPIKYLKYNGVGAMFPHKSSVYKYLTKLNFYNNPLKYYKLINVRGCSTIY